MSYIRYPTASLLSRFNICTHSSQYRDTLKKVVCGFIHFLYSHFWKYLPVVYFRQKKILFRKTTICRTGLKCHRIIVQHTAYQIEQVQILSKVEDRIQFCTFSWSCFDALCSLAHDFLACRTGRTSAFKNRHETKTCRRDKTATIHFCTNEQHQMRMLIATDWLRAVPCTFGSLA